MDTVWKTDKAKKRIYSLFQHSLLTDVDFLVGPSKEKISAHKAILASGSPVFHAMFYGSLPETTNQIGIPDIHPDIFQALLRYFYSDDLPDVTIALSVWYAADKYLVSPLMTSCRRLLKYGISVDNVLQVFQDTLNYGEEDLRNVCFYIICENTFKVLHSSIFLAIERKTLQKILESSQLTIKEIDVYQNCIQWAKSQCKEMELESTPINLRLVLGNVLFLIRFPLMSIEEFANGPAQSGILTEEECSELFMYHLAIHKPDNIPFCTNWRRCVLLPIIARTFLSEEDQAGIITALKFQSSKKLLLIALDFYVRDDYPSQIIRVRLENQNSGDVNHFLFNICPFSSGKLYFPMRLEGAQLNSASIQPHSPYVLKLLLIEEQDDAVFTPHQSVSLDRVNFSVSVAVKESPHSVMAPALLFTDQNAAANRPILPVDSLELIGVRFYQFSE